MSNRRAARLAATLLLPLAAACRPAEAPPKAADQTPPPAPARPAASAPALATSGAWLMLDGRPTPLRYLCDGVDRPLIIAVLEPNAAGETSVAVFRKIGFGAPEVTAYTLGQPDPGAGQIYEALSAGGAEAGYVRRFNPGVLEDPASATLPTVSEIKLGGEITRCRWAPNARFLGFTARRSVLVTASSNGLAYAAFDFEDAPRAAPLETGAMRSTVASAQGDAGDRVRLHPGWAELATDAGVREPFVAWVYTGALKP